MVIDCVPEWEEREREKEMEERESELEKIRTTL